MDSFCIELFDILFIRAHSQGCGISRFFLSLRTAALLPPFSGKSNLLFQRLAAIFGTIGQKLDYSTTTETYKNYEKEIDSLA